jgi:hypothetical protein
MAGQVDSFFGFLDKHLKEIAIGVGALFLLKTLKSHTPDAKERAELTQAAQTADVNNRLVPPPPPSPDKDGQVSKAAEIAYNAKLKAHRSAAYAAELYDHMHTGIFRNVLGSSSDKILNTAFNIAIARITFPQLQKDYLSYQVAEGWRDKETLIADLKYCLSGADYLIFMQRVGLTAAQAYALSRPPTKPKQ